MIAAPDMRVLELLTARLCHELTGPIAAIGNGAELLADDDAGFAQEAAALIADSARRAGSRLQFYRFAYGFGGAGPAAGAAPCDLAAGFFAGARIACDYPRPVRNLPLDWQKLGCNLLLVGSEALPRGGALALDAGPAGPGLEVIGEAAALSPEAEAALTLSAPVAALTPRTVQSYFTGLVARTLGRRLVIAAAESGRFRLSAAAG